MNKKFLWGLIIFMAVYLLIQAVAGWFIDYQWFKMHKGLNVFWTLFLTRFNVQGAFSMIFIALFLLNFLLIRVLGGSGRIFTRNILDRLHFPMLGSPRRALLVLLIVGVLVAGFFMGMIASAYWKEYLMYGNSVPFTGMPEDPIFKREIGFYIFSLPFYKFILGWLMASFIIITLFSAVFHIFNAGIFLEGGKIEFSLFSRAHLSTLLALIVLIHGIGYRISAYELLFSERGKFFGAGYTAVNAQLLAYNVCMVLSFLAVALLLFNIFKRSFRLPAIVLITLIPVYFVLGTVYPSIQQRFIVEPNELDKERPYIQNNITFTRLAYDIDRVREKPFANNHNLTFRDLQKNRATMENVRLWDWRPLKQTYKQLQELKPYYDFLDVDVDRYIINREKKAVNLSARDLITDKLSKQSQTWINRHLVYTHGYGMVLSRVDRITPEGLPEMLIYDIPPKAKIPIEVKRPEIYYGENNNPFILTNTSIQPGEFDYPFGDTNKYSSYTGNGGIKLGSFFKRVLFAIAFNDINVLIAGAINEKSRLHFRRNILEMVKTFTPFLDFEDDPYLVVSEGKMYWMIDAYTTSDRFPYSTPIRTAEGDFNYVRNSVKVVIDAYNGTMDYYIADPKDPILKTYTRIFPGLFKDLSAMPADLRAHIRYPENLFNVQCQMLLRYHMKDVTMFYNNEDAWEIPRQVYEHTEEPMHSYYMVTTLPGETRSEFILILPFTPIKKDNMIAFLVAKCDVPYYGELTLYTLPKEKLSYGPMQIEARVNQDAEISKLLTLWSQKGSKVIKGNMMVIPVEESLLFFMPLYLRAETSEMPELKMVISSFADRVAMAENLDASLGQLFTAGRFTGELAGTALTKEAMLREYAQKAYMYFQQAEKYQREGNWAKYGEELQNLRDVLGRMRGLQ